MGVVRVYREGEGGVGEKQLLKKLQCVCPALTSLQQETCYYILAKPQDDDGSSSKESVTSVLGREGACKLWGLLGDPWLPECGLHTTPQLSIQHSNSQILVEIGPRLSFTTAWSTNAVSVCHAAGLQNITRLERAQRYLLTLSSTPEPGIRAKLVAALHDPMTEQEYATPLESFAQNVKPQEWREVDVLGKGRKALQEANTEMGLAFDEWDVEYYTDVFVSKVQRNPTTVELFDLAQSNSEHSRHWFFKGRYTVDGEKLEESLLSMVQATNTSDTTNTNNVIAFSDNSSGIEGWETPVLLPSDPTKASEVNVQPRLRHIIFTAETHNFPTGVAPFSGATSGTGGRIRDVQAAGRGGHVVAGTAGYCFGNLLIPGYEQPWEPADFHYPANFAPPLEIAIQASNGASDYGNKFGEPVIAGFARSFGLLMGQGDQAERREWVKPIMFSGGLGTLDASMVKKCSPQTGDQVVKVGGPVYRIGVGGGAASSVQVQGDNEVSRDLGAVQRGDAEMEQKMNRVIRGCLEMAANPILALHDQGAGGNANVLKELLEGSGGVIFRDSFSKGDPTLSTLEVWGAEYQESNALLVKPNHLPSLTRLAERERCPLDVVGYCSGLHTVRLVEGKMEDGCKSDKNPVDLHLDWVLGKMPSKEFHWTKTRVEPQPLVMPDSSVVGEALTRVLRLPSVASKRYLTNKVDRSVTGLVAQQQCVGPLHTPIADVAVTAASYFSTEGAATSIGEQPVKMLANPEAGARLTVLEALSNLAAAPLTDLRDVKCSANWMWAAKLPGEGWAVYQACHAMCEVMRWMGIGVDGGKDSLSMAARVPGQSGTGVVKAPGSLVVSAYAPCTDITKIVTPDLKSPGVGGCGSVVWVRVVPEHARLAGSALAQVYGQVGQDVPDVMHHHVQAFVAAFTLMQKMIKERRVLALHDVSDGGVATCLLEMCVGGWGGMDVDLPPAPSPPPTATDQVPSILAALFSEETGWVMEVDNKDAARVVQEFHSAGVPGACILGTTTEAGPHAKVNIHVGGWAAISMSVLEVAQLWEETSYQLEKLQVNPDCADEEYTSLASYAHTSYHVPFTYRDFVTGPVRGVSVARVAVVREEGSNGDREMVASLIQAGFCVHDVTMTDLLTGKTSVNNFRGLVFPGGFSYADVLGSAVGWTGVVRGGGLGGVLDSWRHNPSNFSLGVCNGCQLMALLGWLDPPQHHEENKPAVRLVDNLSGRFESRWSRVLVEDSKSILLKDMAGAKLGVWVAHGEGRFTYRNEGVAKTVEGDGYVALRYLDHTDSPTTCYPHNPNGSPGGVAGMTSSCGRHLAMMPHPERCVLTWQWPHLAPPLLQQHQEPRVTAPWAKLFQNAFDWCHQNS